MNEVASWSPPGVLGLLRFMATGSSSYGLRHEIPWTGTVLLGGALLQAVAFEVCGSGLCEGQSALLLVL